jgi:putative transcriptional regulator
MKKGSITKFRLNPKKPPKTDWRAFDAMSEAERHQAALSDPACPPAIEAQLARARRVPTVRALRKKLNMTQEEFAARFHLPLGTIRDWEQGAHRPDKAAQVLLRVIANDPDAVARTLESSLRQFNNNHLRRLAARSEILEPERASMSEKTINLRGLKCPLPALRTRKALAGMAAGDLLVIECTDPLAAIDIPNLLRETNDTLEDSATGGEVMTFRIRKR